MEELDHFLKRYEQATNSHNFENVVPLVAYDAVYWFSDGSYEGFEAIGGAFASTWNTIVDERYTIENIRWVGVSAELAVCIYDFFWEGRIDGVPQSGGGRGTNVMKRADGGWRIVHEHLSRYPAKAS